MEPGLDPHLHRRVQAAPLRAPQPRAREKTRDRKRKVSYSGKKYFLYTYQYKVPLWDVSNVRSQVEKGHAGNTVTTYLGENMEHGMLCYCSNKIAIPGSHQELLLSTISYIEHYSSSSSTAGAAVKQSKRKKR